MDISKTEQITSDMIIYIFDNISSANYPEDGFDKYEFDVTMHPKIKYYHKLMLNNNKPGIWGDITPNDYEFFWKKFTLAILIKWNMEHLHKIPLPGVLNQDRELSISRLVWNQEHGEYWL